MKLKGEKYKEIQQNTAKYSEIQIQKEGVGRRQECNQRRENLGSARNCPVLSCCNHSSLEHILFHIYLTTKSPSAILSKGGSRERENDDEYENFDEYDDENDQKTYKYHEF